MKKTILERTQDRILGNNALAIALLLAAGGISAWTFANYSAPPAQGERAGEKAGERDAEAAGESEITLSNAPAAVRASLAKITAESTVTKVLRETDEDIATFEVEFTENGSSASAIFSMSGEVMEIEKSVPQSSLPAAAAAALMKEYPDAAMGGCIAVQKMYFEVEIIVDGIKREIKIDAAGSIEDDNDGASCSGSQDADDDQNADDEEDDDDAM